MSWFTLSHILRLCREKDVRGYSLPKRPYGRGFKLSSLKFKNIPNTSNRIEGGINAQIQRHIDHHRGTTLLQRRKIIAALLRQKQLQKPTQNVT